MILLKRKTSIKTDNNKYQKFSFKNTYDEKYTPSIEAKADSEFVIGNLVSSPFTSSIIISEESSKKPIVNSDIGSSRGQEFVAKLFKDQIHVDKLTEGAREEVYSTEFNVHDAFVFFTGENKHDISLFDLRLGLERLEVNRNREEVENLMKRYDLDNDGKLSFKEFEEMIVPKCKKENKNSEGKDVQRLFQEFMEVLIDNEMVAKISKSNLFKSFGINKGDLSVIFMELDKENKGYLTSTEVTNYKNYR